jgi:transcriptional regulator with XRE-family HTH domain
VDVGPVLRQARQEAGLGQAELARRAGVSRSAVNRYETGVRWPSLAVLDRLLEACGRDVRMTLVRRHQRLHDELDRLAALDAEQRSSQHGVMRRGILRGLVEHGTDALVGGQWAVDLHGIPSEPGEGLVLVPRLRVERLLSVLNAAGPPWRLLDGIEWTAGWATEAQLAPGVSMRWRRGDSGVFRTGVVEPGQPWPPEERVETHAGPLRVLAASELRPEDGVLPEVLDEWHRWRARRAGRAAEGAQGGGGCTW